MLAKKLYDFVLNWEQGGPQKLKLGDIQMIEFASIGFSSAKVDGSNC